MPASWINQAHPYMQAHPMPRFGRTLDNALALVHTNNAREQELYSLARFNANANRRVAYRWAAFSWLHNGAEPLPNSVHISVFDMLAFVPKVRTSERTTWERNMPVHNQTTDSGHFVFNYPYADK